MLNKNDALKILHENIQNKNLHKHHYAVAAAMKGLAIELGGDPEVWEIVGLLHDADYEKTKDKMELHTILLAEILEKEDVGEEVIRAIQSHAYEYTGKKPQTKMEFALLSCDDLTGLIVAVALVHPEKLAGVTVKSVMKKFGSKSFAAGADREKIKSCEENLNIPLEDFTGLVLKAMQVNKEILGL
ncbi:MAG: HDIG domain-containing protein [Candidatus Aenigmarchaeota archaeon]|nr:HDIG domain-containing protein [Candidatus Aenigmarchaeota archaeon]